MSELPPQVARRLARVASEAVLDEFETRLILDPGNAELRLERARLFKAIGRVDEAKQAYRQILMRNPAHPAALRDLSKLLYETGSRRAAQLAARQLVAHHPQSGAAGSDLGEILAGDRPRSRVRIDTLDRGAHPLVRVLLLGSIERGNVPTVQYMYDERFLLTDLVLEYYRPTTPLPPHHVVFNTVGDADRCGSALETARLVLARTNAPVVNQPEAVMATRRAANAERLGKLPDVVAPHTAVFPKQLLDEGDAIGAILSAGFTWPLLLRTPGYHTGEHFLRVEGPDTLPAAIAELPGEEVLAIQYLDARSPDGNVRKYRVMIVDGRLYPLHVAVSERWKVHYFSADMSDHPEHRAEDAEFLENMPGVLGRRGLAALENIREVLGLDYGGIDFALDAEGRVLLFEANATMVIPAPPEDERWSYRRAPVQRIIEAARAMFLARAITGGYRAKGSVSSR